MLTTTLIAAENRTGYYGVYLNEPGQPKPYLVRVQRGGKEVCLGSIERTKCPESSRARRLCGGCAPSPRLS